jgi:hypothetical protein
VGLAGALEDEAGAVPSGPDAGALDDLRRRLKGPLLLPGDAGYGPASDPANGRYRFVRPVAIAQVLDEADVVTAVNWSRENEVQPVARGGGHSYAGYSTTTGLLIDLSKLNSVTVNPGNGVAVSGGAATNLDFYKKTADGPFYLPGGTCFGVGVGGLTLGGGIGYNTHWAGLTCDHMTSTRMVTASGDVVVASPNSEQDLYWALRGGAGGNFGINTQFTFQTVRLPKTNIGYYRFEWKGADAAEAVFAAFQQLLTTAPDAFNAVAMAQAVPGTGSKRDNVFVMSRGQYIGPLPELRSLVQPLMKAAPPAKKTFIDQGFWDTQRIFFTTEGPQHSFGDISRYADAPVPDATVTTMVNQLVDCPANTDDNNGSLWCLGWVGGVGSRPAPTSTAYAHRNMLTLWRPTPVWDNSAPPALATALENWTDEVIQTLNPVTPNQSYQNFPNRRIPDYLQAYYAENLPRLVQIKAAVDPDNLFFDAQSIPTALPPG